MTQSVLLILGISGLIGLIGMVLYFTRKWGLVCKSCRKTLVEKKHGKMQLTGKCSRCGAKIFDETPASDSATARRLDREEFEVQFEVLTRRESRRTFLWLAAVLYVPIFLALIIRRVIGSLNQGTMDWMSVGQMRCTAMIILGGFLLSLLSFFLFSAMGKLAPRGLPCPECGRSLLGKPGKIALASGICIYCGCRPFGAVPLDKTVVIPDCE